MEKIDSFKVDHTRLLRGIYTSRKDHLKNGDIVTTFDIRMKEPNREPAIASYILDQWVVAPDSICCLKEIWNLGT